MSKGNIYKMCFVPLCKSTTIKTSEKLFFYAPQAENVKKKGLKVHIVLIRKMELFLL